ncbi:S8 family serine peptidase [Streptomyces poonensis]|uniref:Peptidase S8/S53 domain-containing protein n=1 Tax=Streptomyces poonensis TaxID=68255 RepID=A0A918QAK7_9ACTN|nr:S8 family serine peptidase [Streptomyces poonensis]GGZ39394.1 hypothetical protein GCM10010365_70280 [Streptomyces poonensis]GLJ93080.1 hypothetical protein GCM10017589_56920 [Streptomyces poonensis]
MAFTRTVRVLSATALTGSLILTATPGAFADQTRDAQWHLETLQAESVWEISKGKGVTVAVIDTGVNTQHVDLRDNLLKGYDFEDNDEDPSPEEGDLLSPTHGTGMASLIAGHGHGSGAADGVMGLAPEAKILPIRSGGEMGFAEEIRYAVDHGASVINISQGESQGLDADREAVAYALQHDALIVTASGNAGSEVDDYPALYPGVLTVGGVNKNGTIWEGSNYGPEVLLSAPAARLVSASWPGNKLRIADGTSGAAALTSAAAALIKSKYPDLTPGQIVNRLVKTAVLPDSIKDLSLPDEKYGYGAIRPLAALTGDIPAGGEYGPLKVPESLGSSDSGVSGKDYAAENAKADQKQMVFLAVLGLVSLAVIGLFVFLIVKLTRRNRNKNSDLGVSAGYPHHYGQQPVPQQQNPYQQQSTPPHGQWPPQQ